MQFAELDQESWWQEARLRPYAERVATAVKYYAELGTRYLQEQPGGAIRRASTSGVGRGLFSVGSLPMCGLVGIVGHEPVNQALYDALTVLQHRGQDAAGIMTDDGGRCAFARATAWSATCSTSGTC